MSTSEHAPTIPSKPTAPGVLCYRRLRAPTANREVLIEPGWEHVGELVRTNRQLADASDYELHGRSWRELRRAARTHLVHAAWQGTMSYCQGGSPQCERPPTTEKVFLAGHQPELFHPGVWLKNFVLGTLARQHGAVAINLVVDSDVPKRVAIAVPTGPRTEPRVEMVPFDRIAAPGPTGSGSAGLGTAGLETARDRVTGKVFAGLGSVGQGSAGQVPYEERAVLDEGCFWRFGSEVVRRLAPHVAQPFIEEYWPTVLERFSATANLGQCLAQARHLWEARWGVHTLEVPLSRVCESEAFRWFTVHLFARLPDFWQAYNTAVADYRRVYRVRHPAQPVPRLGTAGEWLEAPFWLWQRADPVRRPVFVRRSAEGLVLSDLQDNTWCLPFSDRGDLTAAVARLAELAAAGMRLRPRALITTLWARLALGDLFIHGIGGAKYDQITDVLIAQFFGLPAPGYMVVSGTLHLPVAPPGGTYADTAQLQQQLWALQHHPERFFPAPDPEAAAMIAAKRRWLATPQTAENARTRCHEIRRLNAALSARLEPLRRELLAAETTARRNAQTAAIWTSREYAFCLFPAGLLRDFLRGATSQVPANLL